MSAKTARISALARAILLVEFHSTDRNRNTKQSENDISLLNEILFTEANSLVSEYGYDAIADINDALEDAGWENLTFVRNRDQCDPLLISWNSEI